MEEPVEESLEVNTPEGTIKIKIGGTIDRMDCKEDTLRIVDYKTGGSPKTPANIEQLFIPAEGRPNYIFQTFLYAAIMSRKQSLKVAPALLYIHRAANESYSPVIEIGEPRKPKIPVNNFAFFEDEFRERLQRLLEEIFGAETPFTQTENTKACEYSVLYAKDKALCSLSVCIVLIDHMLGAYGSYARCLQTVYPILGNHRHGCRINHILADCKAAITNRISA